MEGLELRTFDEDLMQYRCVVEVQLQVEVIRAWSSGQVSIQSCGVISTMAAYLHRMFFDGLCKRQQI